MNNFLIIVKFTAWLERFHKFAERLLEFTKWLLLRPARLVERSEGPDGDFFAHFALEREPYNCYLVDGCLMDNHATSPINISIFQFIIFLPNFILSAIFCWRSGTSERVTTCRALSIKQNNSALSSLLSANRSAIWNTQMSSQLKLKILICYI